MNGVSRGARGADKQVDGLADTGRARMLASILRMDIEELRLQAQMTGEWDAMPKPPMSVACFMKWPECVAAMAEKWPDMVHERDDGGAGPLTWAVKLGNFECVKALIEAGAKDEISCDGMRSSMWACAKGDVEMVDALFSGGADPLAQAAHGETPLMLAASRGGIAVLERLWQIVFPQGEPLPARALDQARKAVEKARELGAQQELGWIASRLEAVELDGSLGGLAEDGAIRRQGRL